MKKQKICIVGDGLTGLTTALILSKLNVTVDIVSKKNSVKKFVDNRTTAISEDNYFFLLNYLNIHRPKEFWESKEIDLYYEKLNQHYHFMNFKNNNKTLMYIIENKKLKNILLENIKKEKNISIIKKEVKKISLDDTAIFLGNKKYNYDLVVLCSGKGSKIVTKLVGKRIIEENSGEIAITAVIEHKLKLANAKQYFLKEGPLAILPISKKKFSYVWSVDKKQSSVGIKNFVSKKLRKILNTNEIFTSTQPTIFPISFKFNTNFFRKNFLVLGEGIYNVHPVAGQGFNLIIRDIRELSNRIEKNIKLGFQIKDSFLLKKFMTSRKPENFLFGIGVNLTNKFFKNDKSTTFLKDIILKDINKFKFLKDLSLKISNTGIFK